MSAAPHRPSPARPPARRRPGVGRFVFALVLAVAAALAVLPDLVRLDRSSPFAQLVSFRPALLAALAVVIVVLALITLQLRWAWPIPAALAVVLVAGVVMVVPRTIAEPVPTTGTPLKILSFNVFEGSADQDQLTALIAAEQPDLVAMPEAGQRFADRLRPRLEPLGYRVQPSVNLRQRDVAGVTVAVSRRLGDVSIERGTRGEAFTNIEVTGGALGSLRFIGFHSVAPTPGATRWWTDDLAHLRDWCTGNPPTIIAGDFNATYDHSALREDAAGCGDAAAQRGESLLGTWPSWAPEWIGPQIDHVLATRGIVSESFEVRKVDGSDHRPVLTTVRIP
ncbi:MAG: endonuclease/exonuclease/phosphatase family protein [Pseudonocardia sp.]|nr:endonuclease/exonuclease/phosphatase family protein [Pseudonocardia sp.]